MKIRWRSSVMRYFVILLLFFPSLVNAQISINVRQQPLKDVIKLIESKSEYRFFYNESLKGLDRLCTLKTDNVSIDKLMSQLLSESPISYRKENSKLIVLYQKSGKEGGVNPQKQKIHKVSGSVRDDSGAPLPGATVIVKGNKQGVITDVDGAYTLQEVGDNAILEFSFLGMTKQEVVVDGQTNINITLHDASIGLNEVVAIGYATQKKVNVIGSVATIGSKTLENRPVTTLASALSGLATGVYVQSSSGKPGSDGANILIRGTGTLNSTSPLVVIDGIVGSTTGVNPNDVESVSVLKDAATAAIYGSLASNGVILITTKSGSKGKISVNYSGNLSITQPNNLPGFVSDYVHHMQFVNEGYTNIGQSFVYTDATIALWKNANANPDGLTEQGIPNRVAYPNTDWSKAIFQNKLLQNHNISLRGGSQNSQYLLSVGYLNNPGTMPNTGSDQYKLRVNLQSKVTKFLTVGTQTFGSVTNSSVTDVATVFSYLKATVPGVYPEYKGKYGYPSAAEESATANNPLASLYATGGDNTVSLVNSTVFANLDITKGLRMEAKAHYDYAFTENNVYPNSYSKWDFASNTARTAEVSPTQLTTQYSVTKSHNIILDYVLKYNTTIAGKHDIGALAGYNQHYFKQYNILGKKTGLLDASLTTFNSATTMTSLSGDASDYALRSFFGRLNYAYNQKYLFEVVMRYDGSSRFSKESRWGFFPAFSGGWRISEEPFMKGVNKYVDNLKLRVSWGQTGNNASGNYDYQAAYNKTQYSFNGVASSGLIQKKSANPYLKWETTTTTNLGLSGSLFNEGVNFELDVYNGFTDGILFVPTIPITTGTATAATQNIAQVTKRGIEFTLGYNGQTKDFNYSISGNVAYNYNKVKKYKGSLEEGYFTNANNEQEYSSNIGSISSGTNQRILEGHRINEYYLYPVYRGNGSYINKDGSVNKNGGPKDGMIRTKQDMNWLQMMVDAGYIFQPSAAISKSKIWYGDLIYADTNGDGIYGNSYDQKFTGKNSSPSWNYGLNMNASYKGFDISMIWAGSAGMSYCWSETYMNQSIVALGKAVPTLVANDHYYYNESDPSDSRNNINGHYPRLKVTDSQNTRASDYYLYDASYLKLKSLQIGYTVPKRITRQASISNARIFIGGENLLTITNYPGIDPEIGATISYPTMRQYTLGLNITF
ncbi:MAG: TonB-dependent receptor [Bacteroides sp.]|nr:TonB-dependent receptor [Bacteroides sp.]MCI1681333.1 TonB-dependent receptor [Bacteroides sp.]